MAAYPCSPPIDTAHSHCKARACAECTRPAYLPPSAEASSYPCSQTIGQPRVRLLIRRGLTMTSAEIRPASTCLRREHHLFRVILARDQIDKAVAHRPFQPAVTPVNAAVGSLEFRRDVMHSRPRLGRALVVGR